MICRARILAMWLQIHDFAAREHSSILIHCLALAFRLVVCGRARRIRSDLPQSRKIVAERIAAPAIGALLASLYQRSGYHSHPELCLAKPQASNSQQHPISSEPAASSVRRKAFGRLRRWRARRALPEMSPDPSRAPANRGSGSSGCTCCCVP